MPRIIGVTAEASKEAQKMLNRDLVPPDDAKQSTTEGKGTWYRWSERINIDAARVEDAKDGKTTVFYLMGKVLPQVGQVANQNVGKIAHLRIRVNFDSLYSEEDKARENALRGVRVLETLYKALKVELPAEGGIPVSIMQQTFPANKEERSPLAGYRVTAYLVQAPPSEGYDRPFTNVERFAPDSE